ADMALVGRADPALDIALQDVLGDADVVVDFTTPDSALHNARECLEAGVHCVMGTTGADFSALEGVGSANLFVAPNFAIGAVLLMEVSQAIAKHMPDCEIIELHHDAKKDAPSGTALRTAELIRAAGQGEFIELVEASTDLHRPWTYPPNDGPGYRGLLERNRSQDFDFRLVRRTDDDAIVGIFELSGIVRGFFQSAYLGYWVGAPY